MTEFAPVTAFTERLPDGAVVLHSGRELAGGLVPLGERLRHWAASTPDRVFLRETGAPDWRSLSYGDAWEKSGQVGTELMRLGCSAEQPVLILAGNSIDHALVTLAGLRTGIPVAPVSAAYAAHSSFERLKALVDVSGSRAVFVGREIAEAARSALTSWGMAVLTMDDLAVGAANLSKLEAASAMILPDSPAKLMFTSGSTGTPKAVINTHRMMVANQLQLMQVWPNSDQAPLELVDWLPWSHTFGGNFVFNMALWHGGTLTIDPGRPAPTLIGKTLAAMAEFGPTRYFSVPAGYEALISVAETTPELARLAFRNLEFAFCAAAAMPQKARERMQSLLRELTGRDIPLIAGWGSTETAPCATVVHFPNDDAANLGVPLPGVSIKLVPANDRLEMRVKGPNVMPGYWRAPEATASAFDEDGYYMIGDAGRFVDPAQPGLGLVFDGRVAENFKLTSGTWVNVGALRVAIIDAARPYVLDAVIAGHNRDEVGILVFPNEAACRWNLGLEDSVALDASEALTDKLNELFAAYNATAGGSSMRVARFRIEAIPPRAELGETTDKAYLNQRAVLDARAASVQAMFADPRFKVPARNEIS